MTTCSDSAETDPSVETIDDVRELLNRLDLKAIVYHEVVGRRKEEGRDGEVEFNIAVKQRSTETIFEPRFLLKVDDLTAEFVVDISTQYESPTPIVASSAISAEFVEKVAIMAVFPFLREALATTAARMELPVPVLGLIRAGQFQVAVEPDSADSTG